jgi:hypothetical protein
MSSHVINAANLVHDFGQMTGTQRKTLALTSD